MCRRYERKEAYALCLPEWIPKCLRSFGTGLAVFQFADAHNKTVVLNEIAKLLKRHDGF